MMHFEPDLIIEATKVCDQQCPGCYAPNVVSREDGKTLAGISPGLFMEMHSLEAALARILVDEKLGQVSIRGGEPTRHPSLGEILVATAASAQSVYLETHGRWILQKTPGEAKIYATLLPHLRDLRIVVKLSFDSMHGLRADLLQQITNSLDKDRVSWCVAITEPNEFAFATTRNRCPWVEDEKIIFQRKVSSSGELIRPRLGVINVNGFNMQRPTAKPSFNRGLSRP